MGVLAAQGMMGEGVQEDRAGSLPLELFAHVTRFMGRKVLLLIAISKLYIFSSPPYYLCLVFPYCI